MSGAANWARSKKTSSRSSSTLDSSALIDADLARRSFQQALDLDPTYTIVLFHLIPGYVAAGQVETAWKVIDELEAVFRRHYERVKSTPE